MRELNIERRRPPRATSQSEQQHFEANREQADDLKQEMKALKSHMNQVQQEYEKLTDALSDEIGKKLEAAGRLTDEENQEAREKTKKLLGMKEDLQQMKEQYEKMGEALEVLITWDEKAEEQGVN